MRERWVLVTSGVGAYEYMLQVDDQDSKWGFYLTDGDQSWDGGFGIAESWEVIPIQAVPREELENIYCDEDVQLIIGHD